MKRYTEKLFEEVCVEKDVLYSTVPGFDDAHTLTKLHFDVYAPVGDTERGRRAVILVHGGGSWGGDKQQNYIVILGNLLARYGYVCFALDYRLFSRDNKPKYPTAAPYAAMDIEAARQFIAANADRFGIDPAKIAVSGGSAGGMGCVEACRMHPEYTAFVCLWGAYEGVVVPGRYPPTIVIHGTADKSVPFANGEAFFARLQEKGIPAEMVPLADAPHTAIKWLPEFEEKMIRFLDTHA